MKEEITSLEALEEIAVESVQYKTISMGNSECPGCEETDGCDGECGCDEPWT